MHGKETFNVIPLSNTVCHLYIYLKMIFNSKLTGITKALLPIQTARNRLDIFARLLPLNSEVLLHLANHEKLFDYSVSPFEVIEFKKRKLSGAPCIFSLGSESRQVLNHPKNVDRIITTDRLGDDGAQFQDIFLIHRFHRLCADLYLTTLYLRQLHMNAIHVQVDTYNLNRSKESECIKTLKSNRNILSDVFKVVCMLEKFLGLRHGLHDFKERCIACGRNVHWICKNAFCFFQTCKAESVCYKKTCRADYPVFHAGFDG